MEKTISELKNEIDKINIEKRSIEFDQEIIKSKYVKQQHEIETLERKIQDIYKKIYELKGGEDD